MRLYEMFIGDFEKSAPWNPQSIKGCKRFLDRFASLVDLAKGSGTSEALVRPMHKLIKKVTSDIDEMKFNTAIAAMMAFQNEVYENAAITCDELSVFAKLLSPFAPHLAEEVWEKMGNSGLVSLSDWPSYDEALTKDNTVEMPVQINGKVKSTISLPIDADKEAILAAAKADERIAAAILGKSIVKEIVVPGKIINIVIR